jgi:hypothetical protein
MGGATLGCDDPGAAGPRRIVAQMLGVATVEVGNPVTKIVLVESDNFAVGNMLGLELLSHGTTTGRSPYSIAHRERSGNLSGQGARIAVAYGGYSERRNK